MYVSAHPSVRWTMNYKVSGMCCQIGNLLWFICNFWTEFVHDGTSKKNEYTIRTLLIDAAHPQRRFTMRFDFSFESCCQICDIWFIAEPNFIHDGTSETNE